MELQRPETLTSQESTSKAGQQSQPDTGASRNGQVKQHEEDTYQPQSLIAVAFLLASVMISMFLVGLDRIIISTAIPQISNEFNSLSDVGWYGSAYLLTCCAFQLLFGKLYTFFSVKGVFLTSIILFEVASAVCGAAPTSTSFIVGRAIAGIGAAGIFAGATMSVVYAVPLEKRASVQGLVGAMMGIAAAVGPVIGGAFTSNVSWRWCFYINLPFGGVALLAIIFCLKVPERDSAKLPLVKKILQLDILGTLLLLPGVICLLLALQWGGQTYTWSNRIIIALLAVMGILLVAFVVVQISFPKVAMIPPRIMKQRSIVSALWSSICIGSSQYVFIYYLPIWFQSVKGVSAVNSGVRLLPLLLGMIVAAMVFGATTDKIGYYVPAGILGSCIMSVGAGLLTTLQLDSGSGVWIGYQVLYGFGMGLCFQVPNFAAQAVLPIEDVPIGVALTFFGQLIGASIFLAVGENVLSSQLLQRLSGLPGFDPSLVTSGGATNLIDALPSNLKETVLVAYNESLRKVFQIGLILACLSLISALTMEWVNILKKAEENHQLERANATTNTTTNATEEKTSEEKNIATVNTTTQ